jgi:hypothetical protein
LGPTNVKEDAVKANDNTTIIGTGGPTTVFDHLSTAAYLALGIEEPVIDYNAWMLAAEAAWITVAGR